MRIGELDGKWERDSFTLVFTRLRRQTKGLRMATAREFIDETKNPVRLEPWCLSVKPVWEGIASTQVCKWGLVGLGVRFLHCCGASKSWILALGPLSRTDP